MFKEIRSLILIFTISMAFALILPLYLQAEVRTVPDDGFSTIQDAINASGVDDTVIVKSGWYGENLTLKSRVKVIGQGWSSTYLYGGRTGNVVEANSVNDAQIEGFTIYGSSMTSGYAGVMITGGSIIVSNNRIVLNTNGINIEGHSASIIKSNLIYANGNRTDAILDYGIYCVHSNPMIVNNYINRNYGCGVYIGWEDSSGTQFINNTVVDNDSEGIWCYRSSPVLKNNIFTENSIGINATDGGTPKIYYNCLYDNSSANYGGAATPIVGNISVDPLLQGFYYRGYYLDSNSPCIDAGDPDPIFNDPDESRNDMGATGGQGGIYSGTDISEMNTGFIFTSIGVIPVSEITEEGLADVSSEVANKLHITAFSDSPFGGSIWLNGQFGFEDENIEYYRIFIAKWDNSTQPSETDFTALEDPLHKIKYTLTSDGKVLSQLIQVGPLDDPSGLYQRTNVGYYAHRDLKLVLNTRKHPNGKYDLICKGYRGLSGGYAEVPPPIGYNRITIHIDNALIDTNIHQVTYDDPPEKIEECEIVTLDGPNDILRFTITAWHPNGFLRHYRLRAHYGLNRVLGDIVNENYTPGTISWPGVSSQEFDTSALPPWEICAYQFELCAWSRINNGFYYIYGKCFRDHYTITY